MVDMLIASAVPFILYSNYVIMSMCVYVYCWQMLFVRYSLCDPTCRGCGSATANARETLSVVHAVPVHATHLSPRVLGSVPTASSRSC